MMRKVSEPTLDNFGAEIHPAFGMISVVRTSCSPGSVLFDSDIRHQHTVTVKVSTANRKRDLNRDWLHNDREFLEIEMSEAQWAAFVSSMGVGSGVPCTIRRREDNFFVDGFPFQPRIAESLREVHSAADEVFGQIKEALAAYEATPASPAKAKREALRKLHSVVENASSNITYTASSLAEHAEKVVSRARADIEAFVVAQATRLGIEPNTIQGPLEIEG